MLNFFKIMKQFGLNTIKCINSIRTFGEFIRRREPTNSTRVMKNIKE